MRRVHFILIGTLNTVNRVSSLNREPSNRPTKIRLLLHCSRQWQNVRTVILFSNQKCSETQLCTARDSKESDIIIFSDGRR